MTFSGDKLADIEPIMPETSPFIEQSVGNFTFHLDGGALVTDNKAGRILNDAVLKNWKNNNYISDSIYVKKEKFTRNSQYHLTLKGHQEGKSSVFMQVISGLTLFIIPHSIDTSYDLTYELIEVKTGKKYQTRISEDMTTTNWLLFFPAIPFSMVGAANTYDRIAEHAYQNFVKQGAFLSHESTNAELGSTETPLQ